MKTKVKSRYNGPFDQGVPNKHTSKHMRRTQEKLAIRTASYEEGVKRIAVEKIAATLHRPGSLKVRG
jgi:hypothetical protein